MINATKEIKRGAVIERKHSWGLELIDLSGQESPCQGDAFKLRIMFFEKRRKF